jgi:hypothetical protein
LIGSVGSGIESDVDDDVAVGAEVSDGWKGSEAGARAGAAKVDVVEELPPGVTTSGASTPAFSTCK